MKNIADAIKNNIENYCVYHFKEEPRWHLGASEIGKECSRELWYSFRWVQDVEHNGRQYRIFERGHLEEQRFCNFLYGIGIKVNRNNERKQECEGHFGMEVDGTSFIEYDLNEEVLIEFKTNSTGAGFSKLYTDGMKRVKPIHYAQICVYGFMMGLKYCLYMNVNKNDDDIYVELVELDLAYGVELLQKADKIIESKCPPIRISEKPTSLKCKYCNYKQVCHEGKELNKNCRTCKHSKPIENGKWHCAIYNSAIPDDFTRIGCDKYEAINNA